MTTGSHIRLLLWKAGKAIETVDRASIAETGMLISDFTIMEALLHKGPLPINTIGEKVLLTSGAMTAAVNRLEKKGYIQKIKSHIDARICCLEITEKGQKVLKEAEKLYVKQFELLLAKMPENLMPQTEEVLKTIAGIIRK